LWPTHATAHAYFDLVPYSFVLEGALSDT